MNESSHTYMNVFSVLFRVSVFCVTSCSFPCKSQVRMNHCTHMRMRHSTHIWTSSQFSFTHLSSRLLLLLVLCITHMTESWHTYEWVMVRICESFMAHIYECVIWLQLVGSLKLQVSFADYSLSYRALLQKRPVSLRSLLIVATP